MRSILSRCSILRQSTYYNTSLIGNYYVRYVSSINEKPRILFVCVANSCRSQIAEALGKKHLSDLYEVHSAGSTPTTPHPLVIEFLKNKGYDTNELYSKSYKDIPKPIDIAIALCDEGDMECNSYFDTSILKRMCWSQKDPIKEKEDQLNAMEIVYNRVEQLMIDFRQQSLKDWKQE
eukprot:189217_1